MARARPGRGSTARAPPLLLSSRAHVEDAMATVPLKDPTPPPLAPLFRFEHGIVGLHSGLISG